MPPKRTVRVHGMQPPYHPLQILTWMIYPLLIVQFFLLLMPLLGSLIAQIAMSVIFCISAVVALAAGGLTAMIDPADDACLGVEIPENTPTVHCYLCEADVEHTSKHCRTCGKCVQHFDHHCKWLNTCVGKKNYRYFLILMSSVAVMTTLSLVLSIYLLIIGFLDQDEIENRIEDTVFLDGILSFWVATAFLIASICVLLPLVCLLYQLMGFHVMLVRRGITTYDYIVSEQKRLREKKRAAAAAAASSPSSPSGPSVSPQKGDDKNNSKNVELSPSYDKISQDIEAAKDSENNEINDESNGSNAYSRAPHTDIDQGENDDDDDENDADSNQLVVSEDTVNGGTTESV